ncbi:hypothetical protein BH23PAT2_BH23PAT2_07560 [soil metagenome]
MDEKEPIQEIQYALKERDDYRRRAYDMAWDQLARAESDDDRNAALRNLGRTADVIEEFRSMFPEVFGTEEE